MCDLICGANAWKQARPGFTLIICPSHSLTHSDCRITATWRLPATEIRQSEKQRDDVTAVLSLSTNLLQAAEVSSDVSQLQRQTAHQPQRCRQTAAGSQQLILKIERATHFFFFYKNAQKLLVLNHHPQHHLYLLENYRKFFKKNKDSVLVSSLQPAGPFQWNSTNSSSVLGIWLR